MSFEIEKPHGGDHRFFFLKSGRWLTSGFLQGSSLSVLAAGGRRRAKKRDATNQRPLQGRFLSSNIPVGRRMMWDSFFCNNCSVGDSGLMSLMSKEKQSCHCLMFFFFILINVIPSSVCPHVCSIHLHVYYLIFHIVHRSHYLVN